MVSFFNSTAGQPAELRMLWLARFVALAAAALLYLALPQAASAALSWSGPTKIDGTNVLAGVACPSTSQCTAVDDVGQQVTFDPASPGTRTPTAIDHNSEGTLDLSGVACPATSQCTAVDSYGFQVTFDPISPGTPTPTSIDQAHGNPYLDAVACPSTSQCTAVDVQNGDEVTFDPKSPGTPTDPYLGTSSLTGVACPSTSQCTAVSGGGGVVTFDPTSPGTPTPTPTSTFWSGVACPSTSQCTAVGGGRVTFDPTSPGTPTPTPIGSTNALTGVACPSTSQCTAVDNGRNGGGAGQVTFDPTSPVTPPPTRIDDGNGLEAVACPSVSLCVAVDNSGNAFVGQGVAPPPGSPTPSAVPVVLVTGLSDSHPGITPGGDCASVGSMATLCAALEAEHHPVYVPSSSNDSSVPAVIHNNLGVDVNAVSLAQYLSNVVGKPALLVGHSMGGLFSRVAISRYHARALGLFTIGTPFDGSFGADIAEAAAHLNCPSTLTACGLLRGAGLFAVVYFGPAAIADLTLVARAADNLTLGPTGVPTWTFAGTDCNGAGGSYYFPNDGVVGISSAFGATANLGPPRPIPLSGRDFHQSTLQTLLSPFCGPGGLELTDPKVVGDVVAAAVSLTNALARDETGRPRLGGPSAAAAAVKRVPVVLYLQRVAIRSLKPGSRIPLAAGTSLLSSTMFGLKCGAHQIQALPALGGRIFGFPGGALPCKSATLIAPHAVGLAVSSDPDRATASIVKTQNNKFTITVTAKRQISRLVLKHGRRPLGLAQHHRGPETIRLSLTAAQAAGLTLIATIAHHQYTATISTLS